MSDREPYEVRLVEDRWATLRHVVEAVAILAAGIWAFYTFIYQEKIKPASEPAAVNLSVTVSSLGHDRDRDYIRLAYVIRNTGKTEIDIAADAYNVWGERYGPQSVVRRQAQPALRRYDANIPIVSGRLIASRVELRALAVGGNSDMHMIIEPDASETVAKVFAIPRGAYDLIRAQVFVVPIKTTISAQVPVAILDGPSGGYALKPKVPIFEDDDNTDFVLPH
jgi:hypothetical protein